MAGFFVSGSLDSTQNLNYLEGELEFCQAVQLVGRGSELLHPALENTACCPLACCAEDLRSLGRTEEIVKFGSLDTFVLVLTEGVDRF